MCIRDSHTTLQWFMLAYEAGLTESAICETPSETLSVPCVDCTPTGQIRYTENDIEYYVFSTLELNLALSKPNAYNRPRVVSPRHADGTSSPSRIAREVEGFVGSPGVTIVKHAE